MTRILFFIALDINHYINWRRSSTIAILIVATLLSACSAPRPAEPTTITIATGGTGGVYFPLGSALARIYSTQIPGLRASALATVASVFNVEAVEQGKADIAFVQGDVAYFAYKRGTESGLRPHTRLRGMAVLFPNVVQVVVLDDSDIHRIIDFRGRRIGVGSPGSGTEEAARIIFQSHGLNYADVRPGFLSFSEIAQQMEARALDGGFIVASYPVSAVSDISKTIGVRLVPIERSMIDKMRERYPFFKPTVIPGGTYRQQSKDVSSIAIDNVLVCRDDMNEQLVYDLTRILFESLPELARTHVAATVIDPEQGPTTPIPLHPGAARYYRERELLK